MAQFSVKIISLTGSVLGENQHTKLANGHLARDIDELMSWAYAQQADGA